MIVRGDDSSEFAIRNAPLGARVSHGLRRGALIGAYLGVVMLIAGTVTGAKPFRFPEAARVIAPFIAGGALAGVTWLAGLPRIRNTSEAILLAIACHSWLVIALVVAVQGCQRWTLVGALGGVMAALLLGLISGMIMWRGWYKHSVE